MVRRTQRPRHPVLSRSERAALRLPRPLRDASGRPSGPQSTGLSGQGRPSGPGGPLPHQVPPGRGRTKPSERAMPGMQHLQGPGGSCSKPSLSLVLLRVQSQAKPQAEADSRSKCRTASPHLSSSPPPHPVLNRRRNTKQSWKPSHPEPARLQASRRHLCWCSWACGRGWGAGPRPLSSWCPGQAPSPEPPPLHWPRARSICSQRPPRVAVACTVSHCLPPCQHLLEHAQAHTHAEAHTHWHKAAGTRCCWKCELPTACHSHRCALPLTVQAIPPGPCPPASPRSAGTLCPQ